MSVSVINILFEGEIINSMIKCLFVFFGGGFQAAIQLSIHISLFRSSSFYFFNYLLR